MNAIVWVILVLVVIAVIAAVLWNSQRTKRARLRERFGPEYDRAIERTGSQRDAERELADVADRRDALDIKTLSPAARQRWVSEWDLVQARFVDAPAEAVASADSLLTALMRERGYPVDDFDERAALVAADHPAVVENYRAAHAAYDRHRRSGALDTEDLRQSFVHYRALFDNMVEPDGTGETAATRRGTVDADRAVARDERDRERIDLDRAELDGTEVER
jgi:hypothetical protein